MRLPDGTTLMHGNQPYDPVKAHEYYTKHYKAHPRQHGIGQQRETQDRQGRVRKTSYSVKGSKGTTVRLTPQQLTEQTIYANHRVKVINDKLKELNKKLKEKMTAAKKAEKGPTAADKADAAKESKKYRDKNKTKLASKAKQENAKESRSSGSSSSSNSKKSDTVASLKTDIAKTKTSLKAAVARQRNLASAKKNG